MSAGKHFGDYAGALIAREVSTISIHFDQLIQLSPTPDDTLVIFKSTVCPSKELARTTLPRGTGGPALEKRRAILLNGNINYDFDIQALLEGLHSELARGDRVILVTYNSYLSGVYRALNWLGLRKAPLPATFVTNVDLANIARLSGFEIVRNRPVVHLPFRWLGLGNPVNAILAVVPFVRWLALATVVTLRPITRPTDERPSLSIIVPVRNERGNLAAIFERMPEFGTRVELIFVEGGSSDGSWEEIERLSAIYSSKYAIQRLHQKGTGKGDAVRLGCEAATCALVTILDADLTMPPELLVRFYDAYRSGLADFINGTRLVYPMEDQAMRFLNRLGNVFFAKALSAVLEAPLSDSLCGTKLFARHDYRRMLAWRERFGDFDPFGDFELLFPAAILGFGIVDIPIRYRARRYGTTKIDRFRHGFLLLKMVLIGLVRVRLGKSG